jgi:hypothetical protein
MNDLTIDSMFPSKYLRAADLPRAGLSLTIDAVEREQIGGDDKWVIYFVGGEERGLCLNKTNALTIADAYGKKVAEWSGRKIHLRKEKVPFQGGRVDAIRLAAIELDDDIPFGNEAA